MLVTPNTIATADNGKKLEVVDGSGRGGQQRRHSSKRVEISKFVSKFQRILGTSWDAYQVAVSLFIVGKLSRDELMQEIAPVLNQKETRHMHNQLLMSMLANCYKNEPLDGITSSVFGSANKKRQIGSKSSQYEQLKKDILSLSIRERVRLKGITKESGKKNMIQNVMVLTRQALVPKVPIVTHQGLSTLNGHGTESTSATSNAKSSDTASTTATASTNLNGLANTANNTKTDGSNDDANNTSNNNNNNNNRTNNLEMTLISVNDILDMVNEPLCAESYELPERKRLRNIMLGLAREHGLLGGISMKAVDVLYLGLSYHLKSIITTMIDMVKTRQETDVNKEQKTKESIPALSSTSTSESAESSDAIGSKRKRITITTEDVLDTFTTMPHMIQPYGVIDYLTDTMLKNDDDYDFIYREVSNSKKLKTNSIVNSTASNKMHFNMKSLSDNSSNIGASLRKGSAYTTGNIHSVSGPNANGLVNNGGTNNNKTVIENDTGRVGNAHDNRENENNNLAAFNPTNLSGNDEENISLWNETEKVITDTGYNGQESYVIPNKITDVSYLLKSHEVLQREKFPHPDDPVPKINLELKDKEIGTSDELNWVIHDLLAEDM